MILEAIYEPVFDSHSHGFRPGKSCHTALRQISSDFTGVVWFIEGDIQGCFDNINHEKLIEIFEQENQRQSFSEHHSPVFESWVYRELEV